MSNSTADQSLLPPGFRFHPTDEELIVHYLKNRAASVPCPVSIIAEVDIYKFDPWDLPARASFGDKEWYFFTPRDRKYPNGVRPNRAAGSGYWKATGTDKPIVAVRSGKSDNIGVKKALVFYRGKPPKGRKTNWIMHEYRLADTSNANASIHLRYSPPLKQKETSMRLDDWVLCRIYEKSSNHGTPQASADHLSMEDTSFLTSFSDMASQQSRLQLHNELFSDTDFTMLSRFLNDNSQDMAAQEQLLQQFVLGPDMNQALFNSAHCSPVPDFMRVAQHHGLAPAIGGTKRMRMMDGLGGEDDGYGMKNFGAAYSSSSTSGYVSPIDATQTSRIDQSYLLNTQFGFQ